MQDAFIQLREAERFDPTDLITNYLIGSFALRLNRPQQAIDEYHKIDAEAWDRVTVGTWRYERLMTANHLLGRHDEELRLARIAAHLFPTSMSNRSDALVALAALGRFDDVRRAVDDLATVPSVGPETAGTAMLSAAEELRAHGHRPESIELAKRSVAWHRSRPAEVLTAADNRFALAQSLYVAEAWADAATTMSALVKEQPGNAPYAALAGSIAVRRGERGPAMQQAAGLSRAASIPGGRIELRRAQLAALLGQQDQAVELLRDAFARGLSMSTALHRQMDLESLRGFPPFDELMKPKG